jgi:hypothetical protein
MEQNPSLEGKIHLASQEISRLLWKPKSKALCNIL